MLARIGTWLESPRMPLVCGLIAVLLSVPSLGAGLQTDDHLLIDRLERGMPLFRSFRITDEVFARGQDNGTFPWWSGPALRVSFLRPVAELSHRLDFALWGDRALPMHLTNALLYALIAWLAAQTFRRLLPARTAGLAALLFVLNDAHGSSVGWISGRNTLLALMFGLASLWTYLLERPGWARPLASPLLLALALLSGEAGAATLAYLGAHALLLSGGPPLARLRPLLPHALVTIAWVALYLAGGYGSHGAAWYRDVTGAPLATLIAGLADLPIWLFSQLGISVMSALLALPPWTRAIPLVLLLPILALLLPVLRRDRTGRFFALGMLLAITPLFTTLPQDRVLMSASLGGFGLLAIALSTIGATRSRLRRVSLYTLAFLHLALSPLIFLRSVTSLAGIDAASHRLALALPDSRASDVVMVHSPLELLPMYASVIHRRAGGRAIDSLHQLHSGRASLDVLRIDARTLELHADPGWCASKLECIFRSADAGRREGEPRRFGPFVRDVVESRDGHPTVVRFVFDAPLESPRYYWLTWAGGQPVPWQPPAIGARAALPALDPLRALSR